VPFNHDIQGKLRSLGTQIAERGTLPHPREHPTHCSKTSGSQDHLPEASICGYQVQSLKSRQESIRIPAWQDQESLFSRGTSIISSSSSNQFGSIETEETNSVSTRNTDSISLHPTIYRLQAARLSHSSRALDECINTAKGWKPAIT
jgi:hypothetical protein